MLGLALIVAIASLTSVNFFTDRVNRATEIQATELLAADLVVRSAEPIDLTLIEQAQALGLKTALTTQFRSVVVLAEKFELAEVKAVQSGYPLRGQLRISTQLFADEIIAENIPPPGAVWPDARLFQLLGLKAGDQLNLGTSSLSATKVLTYEPDRGGDIFNIAPRLLMNIADLEATGLIQPGSRATHKLLIAGSSDAVTQFRPLIDQYREYDIQDIREARPELRIALDRAEQFLGLAVLVSIALAGLAVALSAQRYAVRHFDNCAIMRCFGAQQDMVIKIYFFQLLILSVLCSAIGCGFGYLGQQGLATLMQGLVSRPLPTPTLTPVLIGMAAGLLTVLGFAMPQILRLKNVTPLRVLRRDLIPLPLSNLSIYLAAACCLLLLTPWQSGNLRLTIYGFLGLLLTILLALLAAWLGVRYLDKLRFKVGAAVRFGLANVVRRANLSALQILAISLGIMVLTLLTLIRTDLLANWRHRLPEKTPNYFLINIQPDEVNAVKTLIKARSGVNPRVYPMVRARLITVNGHVINPEDYEDEEEKHLARRVFNLSVAATLPEDNRLVAGKWWDPNDEPLFSFEDDFARTLNINLGDQLKFGIAGNQVTGKVANTRWVDWDTFKVNFFVVANPGTLDDYPATYISGFYLPPGEKQLLIDLIKAYPSVTVFDVDAIVKQVRNIMEQVIRAIEFVAGFTLLAGIIVLLSALQTTHDERRHESALLMTLGAGRGHILTGLFVELVVLGLIAGIIAALAATIAEILLTEYVFKIDSVINPWVWLMTPLLSTLITVIAGLVGTHKVLSVPPAMTLRKI